MKGSGAWVDVRALCPYCDYATSITARDIRGQRFVLACLDCGETFVVEVSCTVTHRTRALADVDKDEVLDRLARRPGPPSRPAVGDRSRTAAASEPPKPPAPAPKAPPLKRRRIIGTRY